MIYIDQSYDSLCESTHIEAVYQVDDKDVVTQYKTFMLEKAKDLNLVVNPHWLNEMDYHNNNTHLTKQEYNRKCKEWKKILRLWSAGKYIIEILNGVKLDYKYLSI